MRRIATAFALAGAMERSACQEADADTGGRAVSGAPVETRQGQTTLQLQFSKYSPLSRHCAMLASGQKPSRL